MTASLRPISAAAGRSAMLPLTSAGPLRPEIAMLEESQLAEIFGLGYGREGVIGLWAGEGDMPSPDFINEAAIASLRAGETFYPPKRGLPELQDALARYHTRLHGFPADPERYTIAGSGMSALVMALQAILGAGDEISVVTPIWPNVLAATQIAGAQARHVGLDEREDGGYSLDIDRLERSIGPRTRAIFIASPGNPTGWMMETEEQQRVLEICRARNVWLIADEVYARFVYDRPVAPSFLALAEPEDPVIAINSFSKAWAMTGWRLGWLIHPPSLGEVLGRLVEFFNSGCPTFGQRGAVAAVEEGEPFVAELVESCRRNGELIYQRLSAWPRITLPRPQAAFYAFFKVEGLTDSLSLAKELLEETAVGLAPGSAFGPAGEGRIRLCFLGGHERLVEALDRLEPKLGG